MSPQALRYLARIAHRQPGIMHGHWWRGRFAMTPSWRGHGPSNYQVCAVKTYWRTLGYRHWREAA